MKVEETELLMMFVGGILIKQQGGTIKLWDFLPLNHILNLEQISIEFNYLKKGKDFDPYYHYKLWQLQTRISYKKQAEAYSFFSKYGPASQQSIAQGAMFRSPTTKVLPS